MVRDSTINSTKASNSIISPAKRGISKPKETGKRKRKSGTIQVPETKATEITTSKNEEDEDEDEDDEDQGDGEEAAADEEGGKDSKATGPKVEETPTPSKDKKKDKKERETAGKTKRFEEARALFSKVVKKGADLSDQQIQEALKLAYDEFYFSPPEMNGYKTKKAPVDDIEFFFVRIHPVSRSRCLFGRLVSGDKQPVFLDHLYLDAPSFPGSIERAKVVAAGGDKKKK